ncbi:hypothetical protein ACN38_g4276 [Penicillium nordicum]|uniref:Uncharacterized protein n=1 Tax=Penicillium nordicum TaxID=229535 RepID=A0A0M9WHA1_9EURO|nr:hypothetical protein ACN38_g4276 [Penicillium nordicum]
MEIPRTLRDAKPNPSIMSPGIYTSNPETPSAILLLRKSNHSTSYKDHGVLKCFFFNFNPLHFHIGLFIFLASRFL